MARLLDERDNGATSSEGVESGLVWRPRSSQGLGAISHRLAGQRIALVASERE